MLQELDMRFVKQRRGAKSGEKVVHEHDDIATASKERRQVEVESSYAVEEVGTPALLGQELPWRLLHREDESEARNALARLANTAEDSRLEHSQQPRLHPAGKIGGFIEEQRASVGQFDTTGSVGRPGVRSTDDTKELSLGHLLAELREIHGDQ